MFSALSGGTAALYPIGPHPSPGSAAAWWQMVLDPQLWGQHLRALCLVVQSPQSLCLSFASANGFAGCLPTEGMGNRGCSCCLPWFWMEGPASFAPHEMWCWEGFASLRCPLKVAGICWGQWEHLPALHCFPLPAASALVLHWDTHPSSARSFLWLLQEEKASVVQTAPPVLFSGVGPSSQPGGEGSTRSGCCRPTGPCPGRSHCMDEPQGCEPRAMLSIPHR